MVIFTYNDYLDCITNYKMKKIIEMENKIIKKERIFRKNISDQFKINELEEKINVLIEKLLMEKGEVVNFINDFLKVRQLDVKNSNFEEIQKIANIESQIYKIKNQEIFFFVKLQKEFNYHMPYIILTECMEFIKKYKEENLKSEKPPLIIPIVIYIGKEEIAVRKNAKVRYTSFEQARINLSYNLIDLNRLRPIELIKKKSIIGKLMILKSKIDNQAKEKLLKFLKESIKEIDEYLELSEIEGIILTK